MTATPLAMDIETVGLSWDDLDPAVQDILLTRARTDEEREAVPERLALHPGTGRIIAIGMWRPLEERGGVLAEGKSSGWTDLEEKGLPGPAKQFRGSEKEIIREFWRFVQEGTSTVITYNGRSFDAPFLLIRSVILGIEPSRNLMPYRYSFEEHCDLAEVLSFYRARVIDSLAFWCHQFGIPSPKNDLDGGGVGTAYAHGKMEAISLYCLHDAVATAELYKRLRPLIRLSTDQRGKFPNQSC